VKRHCPDELSSRRRRMNRGCSRVGQQEDARAWRPCSSGSGSRSSGSGSRSLGPGERDCLLAEDGRARWQRAPVTGRWQRAPVTGHWQRAPVTGRWPLPVIRVTGGGAATRLPSLAEALRFFCSAFITSFENLRYQNGNISKHDK
jgi:hypothetical protein